MREWIDSAFYSLSCWQLSILGKSLRGNVKYGLFFGHTIHVYIYTRKAMEVQIVCSLACLLSIST